MCSFHGLGMVISPPPIQPPTFGSWLFSPYRRFINILPAAAAAAASRAVPERTLLRVIMRRMRFLQPQKHPAQCASASDGGRAGLAAGLAAWRHGSFLPFVSVSVQI